MDKDLQLLFNELKDNRDSLYKMLEGSTAQSNAISIRKGIEESIKTDILLRLKVKETQIVNTTRSIIKEDIVLEEEKEDEIKDVRDIKINKEEDTFIPSINIKNASFSNHSSIKTKKL